MMFKTLVLPGNGIKGIYTLGALESLGEQGVLNDISHYVAVSSGSIIAAMIIMGMRPISILARVLGKSLFSKVGRVSMTGIAGGSSIFNFDPIEAELVTLFTSQLGKSPTLAEFFAMTDKHFVCLGYDITNHRVLYFSKNTFPDLPVVTAIRASCAFPLLFDAVPVGDQLVVDGGVGCNLPLSWAIKNAPGPVITVHVGTRMRPILKSTPRLVMLKELLSYVIRRPDLEELERCRRSSYIVRLCLDKAQFFDFSHPNQVYLDQFDTGYHLCCINQKYA